MTSTSATTSSGLPIPTVDVGAAGSAALRVRQAGGAAQECLDQLAASSPPDWTGVASQAYLDGRALVSRRGTDLAEACGVLDRAVVDFGDDAAAVLPRWREAAGRLEVLERQAADPALAGLSVATQPGAVEALVHERDDLRVEVAAWERRFGEAEAALSAACSQVLAIVDDGELSTADQLWAVPEVFVQQWVVEPSRLAALLWHDPSQVDDVIKGQWYGLVEEVTHPRRTAEEMAGVPSYADGRWGEGVGTGLSTVASFWGGRRFLSPDVPGHAGPPRRGGHHPNRRPTGTPLSARDRVRFARNIQDRGAPLPRPQTLTEMIAGVDLTRSEHAGLGHTLSRHVDVDADYLEFRLRHGTPMPDGSYNRAESTASQWTDRRTAEDTITEAVRQNELELQDWVDHGEPEIELTVSGGSYGTVMTLDSRGRIETATATTVTIRLRRLPSGEVYVQTTLLGVGP